MDIDPVTLHRLKNQLSIVLGFCELMLEDTPALDKRHGDLLQIQAAAATALAQLPSLPPYGLVQTLEPRAADAHLQE